MITLDDAKRVSEALVREADPLSVILFGSVARQGSGTDLDFLVVTEDEEGRDRVVKSFRNKQDKYPIDYFVACRGLLNELLRKGSPFLNLIRKEGRVIFMKDSLLIWLKLAVEDFRQAEYLHKGGFFRGACFAAQQAAEKALKAELIKRGWELEKIHHIRRLIYIGKELGLSIEIGDDDLDFLDSIYRGRYPAEEGLLPLSAPGASESSRALVIAGDVLRQIKALNEEKLSC